MDRKSIIVLLVSFLLILGWFKLVEVMYPPPPRRAVVKDTNAVTHATSPAGTNLVGTNLPAPVLATPAPGTTQWTAPKAEEQLVTVETAEVKYTFTSHGGGLKLAELKRFPKIVGNRKVTDPARVVTLNTKAPVAAMTLLGGDAVQGDGLFTLAKSEKGVRAEKLLPTGLRIVKEFTPGSNYLMQVSVWLENTKGEAIAVPEQHWVFATATPINPLDKGPLMKVSWFADGSSSSVAETYFENATLGCFPGTRRTEHKVEGKLVWAAAQNQFFTIAAIPKTPAEQLVTQRVSLPAHDPADVPEGDRAVPSPFGFQSAFMYPGKVLLPGGTNAIHREFTLYVGPKEYQTLARLGKQMGNELDLIMDYGGFFGFFAKGLLLSMNGLHTLGLTYAWCIIAITIIIKLLFWPLTAISTRSMKRMAELQPQMKAIQDKYKDDPAKMQQKTMEFYKEQKVNPMAGCLPMLVQFPVLIGFYTMLQSCMELRGENFLWAHDLSQEDTVAYLFGFPVNPLPIVMAVTMFYQARLTPPSPGMDPMQQKIMKYMPMMFVAILYRFSAALTLYWTVQNLLTILQTKLTKQQDDKKTAATNSAPTNPKK
ncbi:MAG: membrane protein insertase YidC [Limisphaerales bacterium]